MLGVKTGTECRSISGTFYLSFSLRHWMSQNSQGSGYKEFQQIWLIGMALTFCICFKAQSTLVWYSEKTMKTYETFWILHSVDLGCRHGTYYSSRDNKIDLKILNYFQRFWGVMWNFRLSIKFFQTVCSRLSELGQQDVIGVKLSSLPATCPFESSI